MLHRHATSSSETEYDSSEDDQMAVAARPRPGLLTDVPNAPRHRFRRRTQTVAASGASIRVQQTSPVDDPTSSNDDTSDALPENDRSFTKRRIRD